MGIHAAMTLHITIPMEVEEFERARRQASDLGIPLEQFLHNAVVMALPIEPRPAKGRIQDLFDLFPANEGEPTDIGRDKDKLIGEGSLERAAAQDASNGAMSSIASFSALSAAPPDAILNG